MDEFRKKMNKVEAILRHKKVIPLKRKALDWKHTLTSIVMYVKFIK